ncbi:MAG: Cna B-type domain-containing protein, partial [Emergencia timonensis]
YLYSQGELHGENLSVTENAATSGYGGGILVRGTLYLEDSTVSGNTSPDYGGGISLYNGKLIGKNLVIENNQVTNSGYDRGMGGGIYMDTGSVMEIEKSVIGNNRGGYYGGGIYNQGVCSIDSTAIKGNRSSYGGGLYIGSNGVIPKLNNAEITGNTADCGAALYYLSDYDLDADECSFSQNKSNDGAMSDILMLSGWGSKNFRNCLISKNSSVQTTVSVKVGKANFNNCQINDNLTSKVGGIDLSNVSKNVTVKLTDTVVKDNRSEGTSAITGGLYIKSGNLIMKSGALYNNITSAKSGGDDLYIEKSDKYNADVDVLSASQMEDGENNFADYVWKEKVSNTSENGELRGTSEAARAYTAFIERNVAQIGQIKYTSLAEAVKAAKSGDTIFLIAGSEDNHGTSFNSETIDIEGKNICIDFDDCTVRASGRLFNIGEDAKLEIKGDGKFIGVIKNKGCFQLNGSITSGSIIHQGKTMVIDGEANTLQIELGKDKYITAGKDFSVNSLELTLNSGTLAQFNGAAATSDLNLVKGCNRDDIAATTNIKGLTNHFVSVIAAGGNIVLHKTSAKGVYLNGKSGDDKNEGLSLETPVKSFQRAKEVLDANAQLSIIYVTGTVEIRSDAIWSLDGTLQRYPGFTGNLVGISSGTLTLKDITLDGSSKMNTSGTSSLVKVNPSSTLKVLENAILQNNDATKNDGSFTCGGAIYNNGNLYIAGGTIQNCKALLGGGIYSHGGAITMNAGTMQNNRAAENSRMINQSAGGAIMLGYGATLTMNGGTIKDNVSDHFGGGISLGSINSAFVDIKNSFVMNGGNIDGNTSGNTGGGIFVQCNCEATINAGYITNNRSKSGQFGGGGIYVNGGRENFDSSKVFVNGQLNLYNTVIRDNTAGVSGGGIANCPTSNFNLYLSNGGAIYQNEATDAEDILVWDTYVGGVSHAFLSEYMLGGGLYHWKDDNGDEIAINELHNVSSIHAHTDCKAGSPDATGAEALAKVFITGNKAEQNGGGIGSNGNVTIGENTTETVDISVKKVWSDQNNSGNKRPDSIKVWLYRNGERISFITIKPNSLGVWPESVLFTNQPVKDEAENDYVYTVKEDTDSLAGTYESSVSGSGSEWTITNKLIPNTPGVPVTPPDTPDVPDTPNKPVLPPDELLPGNPGNPDNPVLPPSEYLPVEPATREDKPKSAETPKTGDDTPLMVALLMLLLSGAGLAGVKLVYNKKYKGNH